MTNYLTSKNLAGKKIEYLGNDTYRVGNKTYRKSAKTMCSPKKGSKIVSREIGYNLLQERIRKSKKVKENSYNKTIELGLLAAVEYGCFGKAYSAIRRFHQSIHARTATGAALLGLAAIFAKQGLEHLLINRS